MAVIGGFKDTKWCHAYQRITVQMKLTCVVFGSLSFEEQRYIVYLEAVKHSEELIGIVLSGCRSQFEIENGLLGCSS